MTLYQVNIYLGTKVVDGYEMEADNEELAIDACITQTKHDLWADAYEVDDEPDLDTMEQNTP